MNKAINRVNAYFSTLITRSFLRYSLLSLTVIMYLYLSISKKNKYMMAHKMLLPAIEKTRDSRDSLLIGDNATRKKIINTRR